MSMPDALMSVWGRPPAGSAAIASTIAFVAARRLSRIARLRRGVHGQPPI